LRRSRRRLPQNTVCSIVAIRAGAGDVIGIFANSAFALRLVTMLLVEQNDEWAMNKRYFSLESMELLKTSVEDRRRWHISQTLICQVVVDADAGHHVG
jgi:ABC-type antimicrobial peptide transport system ATPase subunit